MRALVVDDEEMVSDILKTVLSQDGFEVSLAHDSASALATARNRMPELLVSDMHLPDGNGVQLCRRIADEFPDCRIILITGSSEFNNAVSLSSKNQLNGPVLQKPFSLASFRETVRTVCEHDRVG